MTWIRGTRFDRLVCLLLLIAVAPLYSGTMFYNFQFQTGDGRPVPTGSFGYDALTGSFTNFVVVYEQVNYDFTRAANLMNLNPMPFELGQLGPNLVSGEGVLGPGLSHWYAGSGGFYGFEWRTPAADFLTFSFTVDLTLGPRRDPPLYMLPGAYQGTWTTAEVPASGVPEPATWTMMALAGVAGAMVRRRARKLADQRAQ